MNLKNLVFKYYFIINFYIGEIMGSGLKCFLFFVGGAAVGAAGLALLNKNKMELGNKLNLENVKPLAENVINKYMDYKEEILNFVDGVRENVEEVITETKKNLNPQESKEASESFDNVINSTNIDNEKTSVNKPS